MNTDRVNAAADQAAESARQVDESVVVGLKEWLALLDAIYDQSEDTGDAA